MEEDTELYDGEYSEEVLYLSHNEEIKKKILIKIILLCAVQVNFADQHLRVFDPAQKRWRQVCSSSANQLLASISCEEVGFVRWKTFSLINDCGFTSSRKLYVQYHVLPFFRSYVSLVQIGLKK